MTRVRRLIFACVALLTAALPALAAGPAKPASSQANQAPQVNFGKTDNVLELKPFLSPYKAPGGGTEEDGSSWYIVQVSNDSVRPATRVLLSAWN